MSLLITFPFPLRPGLVVTLLLPDDLTAAEAERVATFVRTLEREGGAS